MGRLAARLTRLSAFGRLLAMAPTLIEPFALAAGEGFTVENPTGSLTTFKALADASDGALTAIEGGGAPGEGPPLHVHPRQDEFIYTLEGTFRIKLGDRLFDAAAGLFIFIPRGTAHTWQNIGDTPARFFAGFTPAAAEFEQFFRRYSELAPDDRGA
jgi:quercetin dioxygenase-like cupin family protein